MKKPLPLLRGYASCSDNHSEIRNHMPEAVNAKCLSQLRGCASDLELMPVLKDLKMASK